MFEAEGAGGGEGRFRQGGFPTGDQARVAVGVVVGFREPGVEARVVGEQPAQPAALFPDGGFPTDAAPFGLVSPLEQVRQQDAQPAFQFPDLALAQVLNLVDQVRYVQWVEAPGPE